MTMIYDSLAYKQPISTDIPIAMQSWRS